MGMARYRQRLGVAVVAVILALATGAVGAAAEDKGPNTGRVSLSLGMDYTTDYYFRGIRQEDEDWIFQPYAEIGFKLLETQGPLNSLSLGVGLWNSLHGGPTGESGVRTADRGLWYEADFYTKLVATLFEDVSAGIIYTAYMSPNGRFKTVQELALSLGWNDSKLLGPFALNPSALLAFETAGQADAGRHRGVFLQIGVAPGVTLLEKSQTPISFSIPLAVGLSLSDYYERIGVGGDDDTFGFFSGGVAASVPLKFIPAAFGSWQAKGSATVLYLGDNLKAFNRSDSTEVIGTLGLALTY